MMYEGENNYYSWSQSVDVTDQCDTQWHHALDIFFIIIISSLKYFKSPSSSSWFLPRKLIPSIEAFKVEIWRTTPSFRNAWAQKFRSRWNVKVEIQIEKNCFVGSIASLVQQYLTLLYTLHCHSLFTHCMHL